MSIEHHPLPTDMPDDDVWRDLGYGHEVDPRVAARIRAINSGRRILEVVDGSEAPAESAPDSFSPGADERARVKALLRSVRVELGATDDSHHSRSA